MKSIEEMLRDNLQNIENRLDNPIDYYTHEEFAILLSAKAQTLAALQKYE